MAVLKGTPCGALAVSSYRALRGVLGLAIRRAGLGPSWGLTRPTGAGRAAQRGRLDGRTCKGEESPDSAKHRCRVTPGQGNLTDSATENKPPAMPEVRQRVTWCGKGETVG